MPANQNEHNIPTAESSEATSMRQKLWLDHFYSSEEALDKIWLQFEVSEQSHCDIVLAWVIQALEDKVFVVWVDELL